MKPNFDFCGYPVKYEHTPLPSQPDDPRNWHCCGKLATPGHAYCDHHGIHGEEDRLKLSSYASGTRENPLCYCPDCGAGLGPFYSSRIVMRPGLLSDAVPPWNRLHLTEDDIANRAAAREDLAGKRITRIWLPLCGASLVIAALYEPVHTWLHGHLQLLLGIVVGSLVEAFAWTFSEWAERRAEREGKL